jgi:hypothetical protein
MAVYGAGAVALARGPSTVWRILLIDVFGGAHAHVASSTWAEHMGSVSGMGQRTANGTHDLSLAELAELGESRATRPFRPASALCAHSGVQGSQSPRGSVASAPALVRDVRAHALAAARNGVARTAQPGHSV